MKIVCFFLKVFLVLLDCCSSQSIVPPGFEMTITNDYGYSNFHHISPTNSSNEVIELRFGVNANRDAHIAFAPSPLALNPLYEIVIGSGENQFTTLRRSMQNESVRTESTPYVLSDTDFRHFWISIRLNGEIEVGKDGEKKPLLQWKDPNPFPVHYYSFCSWGKAVVKWILKSKNLTATSGRANSSNKNKIDLQNAKERLRKNLFQNYNKEDQPSSNYSISPSISLGISVAHFELNEMTSKLVLHARFRLTWKDDRLKWNASDYHDITSIYIPSFSIWQPDVSLANDGDKIISFGQSNAILYEEGFVLYTPPMIIIEALCDLDMRNWPFDSQSCAFEFGSWSHSTGDRFELELFSNQSGIHENGYNKRNLKWDLENVNTNVTVKTSANIEDENVSTIFLNIVIGRKSTLYRATLITPIVVITLLTIGSFLLPPNASEKILIGVVNSLILSLYLLYFNVILPPMGNHSPFIVSYFTNTFVFVSVSIILAIFSINLSRRTVIHGSPPYFLIRILTGRVGQMLRLGHLISLVNKSDAEPIISQRVFMRTCTDELEICPLDEDHVNSQRNGLAPLRPDAGRNKLDWLLVAYAIDRLTCLIYVFAFSLMTILEYSIEF